MRKEITFFDFQEVLNTLPFSSKLMKMNQVSRIPGINTYQPEELERIISRDAYQRLKTGGIVERFFSDCNFVAEYVSNELELLANQTRPAAQIQPLAPQPKQQEEKSKFVTLARTLYNEFSGDENGKRTDDYSTFFAKPIVVSKNPIPLTVTRLVFYGAGLNEDYRAVIRNPFAPERSIERAVYVAGKYLPEYRSESGKLVIKEDDISTLPFRTFAVKMWARDIQLLLALPELPKGPVTFLSYTIAKSATRLTQAEVQYINSLKTTSGRRIIHARTARRLRKH